MSNTSAGPYSAQAVMLYVLLVADVVINATADASGEELVAHYGGAYHRRYPAASSFQPHDLLAARWPHRVPAWCRRQPGLADVRHLRRGLLPPVGRR